MKESNSIEGKKGSDWSIGQLYEKSWQIVKNNKVLWIFGMAVAGFTSGARYNFNSHLSSKDIQNLQNIFKNTPTQNTTGKLTQVLGTNTDVVSNTFQQLFSAIPSYFFVILGGEFLLLIILGLVISLIGGAWSKAALIQAIQTCLNNQKPTIGDASEKAFSSIKPLIWLQIVPSLLLGLSSIVVFGILIFGLIVGSGVLKIIFGIFLAVAVFIFIYVLIIFTLTQIWALRVAVLDQKKGKEAFLSGYKLAKKKFWSMLLLGLVNTILTGIIIGTPFVLMFGFILSGVLSFKFYQPLAIGLLIIGAILLITIILGYLILSGILTAFKASIWTIAYNEIRGKYNAS